MIKLPLTSDPSRTFTTTVGLAHYRVTSRWNDRSGVFTLDIDDADTGDSIISGMPVVLGADLLLGFCPRLGSMQALDLSAASPGLGVDAGPDDLGTRIIVLWSEPGEVL